jgi:hypothetical protein
MTEYEKRITSVLRDVDDIVNDIIRMKENPEYGFPNYKSSWKFIDIGTNMMDVIKSLVYSKLSIDYGISCGCKSTRRLTSKGNEEFKLVVNANLTNIVPEE